MHIMNKSRHLIASLLCLIFMLTLVTPAYADANNQQPIKPSTITVTQNQDGSWTPINNLAIFSQTETMKLTLKENSDNVYHNDKNEYYQEISENTFIQVNEIAMPVTDYATFQTLSAYNYPKEVLDNVAAMASYVKDNNMDNVDVIIYAPALNTRLNSKGPVTTTWNGNKFHNYEVWFTNLETTPQVVVKGASMTESVLSTISYMTINAIASSEMQIGTAISLFSTGSDCLSFWLNKTGQVPIYGRTENTLTVNVKYDLYNKYTYLYNEKNGEEYFGSGTQKAIVKQVISHIYLVDENGGSSTDETVYPNKTYYSPNYIYPEESAFNGYLFGYSERVEGKISTKRLIFNAPSFTWPSDWPPIF